MLHREIDHQLHELAGGRQLAAYSAIGTAAWKSAYTTEAGGP